MNVDRVRPRVPKGSPVQARDHVLRVGLVAAGVHGGIRELRVVVDDDVHPRAEVPALQVHQHAPVVQFVTEDVAHPADSRRVDLRQDQVVAPDQRDLFPAGVAGRRVQPVDHLPHVDGVGVLPLERLDPHGQRKGDDPAATEVHISVAAGVELLGCSTDLAHALDQSGLHAVGDADPLPDVGEAVHVPFGPEALRPEQGDVVALLEAPEAFLDELAGPQDGDVLEGHPQLLLTGTREGEEVFALGVHARVVHELLLLFGDLDVVGVVGHDVSEVPGEGHEGIGAAWAPHHLSTRSAEEEEESCCGAALGILAVPVLVDLHEASLVIAPQACEDRIL